jgi:hypothetical protein
MITKEASGPPASLMNKLDTLVSRKLPGQVDYQHVAKNFQHNIGFGME